MEVVLLLILWTACAAFAGWIAQSKGKPSFELAIGLGFLLGPLGVVAVLVMANGEAAKDALQSPPGASPAIPPPRPPGTGSFPPFN